MLCSALQKNGQPCQHVTERSPLCTYHLRTQLGLEIKSSQIKEAGLGLFTTIDRKEGDVIDAYRGRISNTPIEGDYVLHVGDANNMVWIDADEPTSCAARYANMAVQLANGDNTLTQKDNNCILEETGNEAYLVATRDIAAGAELFCQYGDDYWREDELA